MSKKMTPKEIAESKAMEKKIKKQNQTREPLKKRSRLGVESTTNTHSHPVRFITAEKNVLTEIGEDILKNDLALVKKILGSDGVRHINLTKLVRAAVYILHETPNEKILKAILQAKNNMYQDA